MPTYKDAEGVQQPAVVEVRGLGLTETFPDTGATAISTVVVDARDTSAPLTVSFTSNAADPEGQRLRYEWDFDADGEVDSRDPDPTHTYTENGVFNATLQVTAFRPDGSIALAPTPPPLVPPPRGVIVFTIDHRDPLAAASPAMRCVATTAFGRPRAYGPTAGAC